MHPAGKKILLSYGGKDATEVFNYFHAESVLTKYHKLVIGRTTEGPRAKVRPLFEVAKITDETESDVPYGSPSHLQGWHSPYYNETHHKLRSAVRAWIAREILPHANEWEESGSMDADRYKKAGD